MARTPPQTPPCRWPRRSGARSTPVCRAAIVGLVGLWPLCDAQAARSCEEWSAEVSSVEGRVEIRRSTTSVWVTLAAGERVCTDDSVRVGSSSRATLVLPDGGGPLRLAENSILNLPEPPSGVGSLVELLRGIIHVISRDPRSLSFRTPYANAGIEGTEFDIRVDEDERLTEIVVLEGEVAVTTPSGELKVSSDHVAVARDGQAPTASPIAQPIERMRWASHYPPIIDRPLPGADQAPLPSQQADADFYAYRAAARLTTARLEGAEADIATALRLAPRNAAALSLDALLSLARADRDAARARLAEALAADPMSVIARLALSHVEQSAGSLAAAERVIREALALEPDNAIVATRLAELALAQDDARTAIASATRARALAPDQSTPLVVLGFASLRAFDTAAAESAFSAAVELERDAPLPWLGLALDLDSPRRPRGRAAPARARGRSRSGQSADAQLHGQHLWRRESRRPDGEPARSGKRVRPVRSDAVAVFVAAKTAHQSARRSPAGASARDAQERRPPDSPFAAVRSTRTSRRAARASPACTPRSARATRAARCVAHARRRSGRLHGPPAARRRLFGRASPRDRARQRAFGLAAAAAGQRHAAEASARATEPLSCATRGPQPARSTSSTPPSSRTASSSELPRATGGNGTEGHDVSLAGLRDRVSYSAGHYRFSTDGFRENNDFEQELANAFVQYRPTHDTNLQAELRSARTEHGDLTAFFNRDLYSSLLRFDEDVDSLRLGAQHRLTPNHTLLGSVIYQDVRPGIATADVFTIEPTDAAMTSTSSTFFSAGDCAFRAASCGRQDETTRRRFPSRRGPELISAEQTDRQLGLYTMPTSTLCRP